MRKIYLIGEINDEMYKKFSKKLTALEVECKSITIELMSEGGDAYAALAIRDRIHSSTCPIRIKAYGLIASAAVVILAAGHRRSMASSAWVMVHEDSGKLRGDVVSLERESKHLRRLEDQWAKILESDTTSDDTIWERLHKQTTYLNAKECLELGLIDEVIE